MDEPKRWFLCGIPEEARLPWQTPLPISTYTHTHHPTTTCCQSSHNGSHTRDLSCVCANRVILLVPSKLALFLPFCLSSLSLSLFFICRLFSLSLSLSLVSNERNSLPSAFVTRPLLSIIFLLSKDNLRIKNATWVVTVPFLDCLLGSLCPQRQVLTSSSRKMMLGDK